MVNRMKNRADRDKGRGGFVYQSRDSKTVKDRATQTGAVFDSIFKSGFDVFKPKGGTNSIRFLPPTWEDPEHFGYDIWVHGYVGSDNSSYLCPNKMKNKPCPICEAQKEAKDAGEDDEAKKLTPRKRTVAWLIERDGDTDMPQLYAMSWTVDRDIAVLCNNEKTGKVLEIDHPEKGYDVSFKRKGDGLKTEYYGFNIDRDDSPIEDKEKKQDEILAYIEENPIPSVLKFYSEDHLRKVIEGTAASEDDDDKGRRGRRRKDDDDEDDKPRGRGRGKDDDDDSEDDKPRGRGRGKDDDDDAEDDKPRGRRGRDDDDDSEDDKPRGRGRKDDDDDAEDDKPRSRRGRDDDDDSEDDKPRSRRGRDDDDDGEDDKPRGRGRDKDDDDEDDKPRGRRGRDDDDSEDDKPRGRRGRDEEDEEDKDDRSSRRRGKTDDDDDDRSSRGKDDDDEDDKPRGRVRIGRK
jgi:gp32-like DNA binding protein